MIKICANKWRWSRVPALLSAFLLALVLLAAVPSCKETAPAELPPAQEKVGTYTIGVLGPFTGPTAGYGVPYLRLSQMTFDDVNKAGGIKIGDTIYKFNLLEMDDKYTPEVGVAAIEKMIGQGIHVIIGTVSTPVVLAAIPMSTRDKVIMMGLATAPRDFTDAPYMFRSSPDWGQAGALGVSKYAAEKHPNWKKWVVVGYDSEVGYVQVAASALCLYKYPGMDVYAEFFQRGTQDFSATITRFKKIAPDVVWFCGVPPGDMGLCIKQMNEAGLRVPSASHSTDVATMLQVCKPEYLEGYLSGGWVTQGPTANPEIKKIRDSYEPRFGVWDELAANGSTLIDPLLRALKQTKSLDPDDILYALEHLGHWQYVGTDVYFGGAKVMGRDHQLICPYGVIQVHNGLSEQVSILPGQEPFVEMSLAELEKQFGLHVAPTLGKK
jgi:branched-chain amino acid transport system substrate-binding protein